MNAAVCGNSDAGGMHVARKHRLNGEQQQQSPQQRQQETGKKVAVDVGAASGESGMAPPPLPTSPPDPETFARSYQLEALEMAMKGNTIAFLETGSGKTLIAIMLLRAHAHLLRRDPSISSFSSSGQGAYHPIAVFLTPTVILVSQQADVIQMHTDLRVGSFWGDMGVDFWTAATWKEKLQEFEVFVMTPQILLNNLRHGFFNMDMIKLLVFDECHHAKGRHPYACIMTEFYHRQLGSRSISLPRIFGMTASLVNTKGSSLRIRYEKQIIDLESLMASKVYTVANESILAEYIAFSTPKVKFYKHQDIPYDLFVSIADYLKSLEREHVEALLPLGLDNSAEASARKRISKLHATFLFCLVELGVWSALKAAEYLSNKENAIYFWGEGRDGTGEMTVRKFSKAVSVVLSQYLRTGNWIEDDLGPAITRGLLTTKVDCLVRSLMEYRSLDNLRCIIFVERIITAIVLHAFLTNVPKLSGWRTEYMTGIRSDMQSQTRKDHVKIVDAFREGKVNIIVATQILEEGLDVQSCNLVVRFDPSPTVCSFIQSRGRARMKGSDYLLLIRSGDSSTLSRVRNYLDSGDIMRDESLRRASIPCAALNTEMVDEDFYCVASTGAIVTLSSSIPLIYFYCSRLPSDGYFKPFPRFIIDKYLNACTLHLPKSCPLPSVHVEGPKDLLKHIACLEACRKLHELHALTDNLLPWSEVEDGIDDQESGSFSYEDSQFNYFPEELVDSWSSFYAMGSYHCYNITLNQNFSADVPLRNFIMVTKCDLGSDFASVSFNLEENRGSVTVNMQYAGTINLSPQQIHMARQFQLHVLSMLIHQNFTEWKDTVHCAHSKDTASTVAYLVLPSIFSKREFSIDWVCVASLKVQHHCSLGGTSRWIQMKNGAICSCMVQNSVVYAPHNGYIYYITGISDNLHGNSAMASKRGLIMTYKEYYQSRHGISLVWPNESLLIGRHLFKVNNFLLRRQFREEKEWSTAGVELPPELCVIILSPITLSTLYSYTFLPSMLWRIESMLLAARLKKSQLDHCMQNVIPATKVLEALTTKKCREQFSLESLETLGDSFLKYAASLHLFGESTHHHEGVLTHKKDQMISNVALCRLGCSHQLPGFIRTEAFEPTNWIVPGDGLHYFGDEQVVYLTSGKIYNRGTRSLKGKHVADSVEALIGAYLSFGGEKAALYFLKWLGMTITFNKEILDDVAFVSRPEMYINIKFLESLLRYSFAKPSLLVEALTHGSYQIADIPRCYQRLEFLGDAVLDHLITVHLYNKYPNLSPGLLTDLRSASVNNDCYAHAAVKAGLNKQILHASSELHKQMGFYLSNFTQSFCGSSYGWQAGSALPKVLGDVIESIAGAIFVDSGFNKEAVWNSIRPLLEPLVTLETMEYHPVRELNELCARKSYRMKCSTTHQGGIASITVEVDVAGDTITATRTAGNRKTAKKLAARALLDSLKTRFTRS